MPAVFLGEFDAGSAPKFIFPFEVDGTPTDPTTVELRLKSPSTLRYDLTYPGSSDLVRESTGVYSLRPVLNDAGPWHGEVRGTGAVVAVIKFAFMVEGSDLFP